MDRQYILEEWNRTISKASRDDVPPELFAIFKDYFFMGAYTLYEFLVNTYLLGGMEETKSDLNRMECIHKELMRFLELQTKKGVLIESNDKRSR